jgi:putative ABC transport system permease protein
LLAPSLFVGTTALLAAQVFPWLGRLVDPLNSRNRSVPLYMGILNLARQGGQYAGALFLVVACLSLGAFYSSMAESLDDWLVDSIRYQVGADYSFTHGVPMEMLASVSKGMPASAGGSWLLPASEYRTIPGVIEATRVGFYTAVPSISGAAAGQLLGVDRLDFPKAAFWRTEFADVPLGELMNRLGMYDDGVLVSKQFMETHQLQEGQRLELGTRTGSDTVRLPFRIVGSFSSFPSASKKGEEVYVVNLERFFEQTGGVQRHSVWMHIDDDADPAVILERLEDMGIESPYGIDTRVLIVEDEDSVERIGLFGVLSIGFLAGSVLSCIGLLVFTYAALIVRIQRLSLLRAIGARTHEIFSMVAAEYAGVNLYGVLAGVGIGVICSRLFVPFFQFSPDPALVLPSFVPQIAWGRILQIALIFAGALAIAQIAILLRVTRRDVFQQLRSVQRE